MNKTRKFRVIVDSANFSQFGSLHWSLPTWHVERCFATSVVPFILNEGVILSISCVAKRGIDPSPLGLENRHLAYLRQRGGNKVISIAALSKVQIFRVGQFGCAFEHSLEINSAQLQFTFDCVNEWTALLSLFSKYFLSLVASTSTFTFDRQCGVETHDCHPPTSPRTTFPSLSLSLPMLHVRSIRKVLFCKAYRSLHCERRCCFAMIKNSWA